MRKTQLVVALAALGFAGSAFATNGDNLIGLGAQSRALGGTGAAAFFGSENALTNPALLGKSHGAEFAIGGTIFMPDVTATSTVAGPASQNSEADLNVIPEVSMSNRINDNLTLGLGMYGTAGMGVDYRDTDALFNGYTNLQLMKFVPSVTYNHGPWGLGLAAVIQYGALDINYKQDTNLDGVTDTTVGNGTSSDLGFGFNLGGYFDINQNLTVGLAYQSEIGMEYDDQITVAADGFGIGPNGFAPTILSDKLAQPAEIRAGVAYTTGPWLVTADYKRIKWSSADGYSAFNWDDQDVFGLGVKFSGSGWWVGAGYNRGSDPINVLPNTASALPGGYVNQAINMFNNHFFPAVTENHFTLGGGIAVGKKTTVDLAVVYADEVSKTIDTGFISEAGDGDFTDGLPAGATTHRVDHSQLGYTISVRMNF